MEPEAFKVSSIIQVFNRSFNIIDPPIHTALLLQHNQPARAKAIFHVVIKR